MYKLTFNLGVTFATGITLSNQAVKNQTATLNGVTRYVIDGMNEFTPITQAVDSEFYICYVDDSNNKWEYALLNNDKDGYSVISFVLTT